VISVQHIDKTYNTSSVPINVLQDVSLQVKQGEFVAIMGQSGSGKSTLMNILGLLDTYNSGQYHFSNTDIATLDPTAAAHLRAAKFGFVFQSFNLIPRMSAIKNVELPMVYAGKDRHTRRRVATALLDLVGLANRADHGPTQLSGGQQQRVAIARALVNNPDVLIADEPTGSLDSQSGGDIMELFTSLNASGKTIILVTHEDSIASYAQRVISLQDGRIISDVNSS